MWWYGEILPGVDPKTAELVNPGFVWKDSEHVWYQRTVIAGADAKTFDILIKRSIGMQCEPIGRQLPWMASISIRFELLVMTVRMPLIETALARR